MTRVLGADDIPVDVVSGQHGRQVATVLGAALGCEALTTIDVTEPTDANPGRLWRTTVPDTAQAARLVADIEARGIARLAIVYLEGTYGEGLSQQVEAALTGTDVRTYAFASASDLGMRVTEVGASDAQEVLFISSDAAQIASFINTVKAPLTPRSSAVTGLPL